MPNLKALNCLGSNIWRSASSHFKLCMHWDHRYYSHYLCASQGSVHYLQKEGLPILWCGPTVECPPLESRDGHEPLVQQFLLFHSSDKVLQTEVFGASEPHFFWWAPTQGQRPGFPAPPPLAAGSEWALARGSGPGKRWTSVCPKDLLAQATKLVVHSHLYCILLTSGEKSLICLDI